MLKWTMFSNHPKLGLSKILILGAIGVYAWQHSRLKKSGELSGPSWRVDLNPELLAGTITPMLGLNPTLSMAAHTAIREFTKGLTDSDGLEGEEDEKISRISRRHSATNRRR
jgi:hypothetical protein